MCAVTLSMIDGRKGRVLLMLAVGALVCALQASGTALPWESPLRQVQLSLSGPVAGSVSVVALFACAAVLIFGGEMNEIAKKLIYIVMGISIMVGGNTLLSALGIMGTATGCVIR